MRLDIIYSGLREVGYQMKEGPPLYRAASQVLLQHIKNLVELLPRPSQVSSHIYCGALKDPLDGMWPLRNFKRSPFKISPKKYE